MPTLNQIEEFFTYQATIITSINTLILEEKKKPTNKQNKKYLKMLQSEIEKGEYKKTTSIRRPVNHTDDFGEYYNEKLTVFKKDFPFLDDFDFIEWQIKKCQMFVSELEKSIDEIYLREVNSELISNFTHPFEYRILLINKWISFIEKISMKLSISNNDFFDKWRTKKGWYDEENVKEINSIIKDYIIERFKYFKDEYDSNWHLTLIDIFTSATEINFKINSYYLFNANHLRIDCELEENRISIALSDFERFFEYLITNKKPQDCLLMLNLFRNILKTYESILRGLNLYFSKSFLYDTLSSFYSRIEENYNAQKLNRLILITDSIESLSENNSILSISKEGINSKEIYINASGIQTLIENVLPVITQNQHQLFLKLINGESIEGKVQFLGSSIDFSRAFSILFTENLIQSTKVQMIAWAIKYFQYTKKGGPKDFKLATLTTHFNSQTMP